MTERRPFGDEQEAPPGSTGNDAAVEEVRLHGLDADSALALVRRRAPNLAQAAAEHVVKLAEGNPLALLELPLDNPGRDSHEVPVRPIDGLPRLSVRLQEAFGARVSALEPSSRFV